MVDAHHPRSRRTEARACVAGLLRADERRSDDGSREDILSLETFLRLTGTLNLQVDVGLSEFDLLLTVLGRAPPPGHEKELLGAVRLLTIGFGRHLRRKNRTWAILHSLRVGAIVARSSAPLDAYDVIAAFLHDAAEDLGPEAIGSERAALVAEQLRAIYAAIGPDEEWYLAERMDLLTRRKDQNQTYFDYLRRMLEHASMMPNLVRTKLADKIDSLLDIGVILPSVCDLDFHEIVFETLFLPAAVRGQIPGGVREPRFGETDAVLFLSSLGKSLLFLCMLRSARIGRDDPVSRRLSERLPLVALEQARWVLLHHLRTKIPNGDDQRAIFNRVRKYCERPGALARVTGSAVGGLLDGMIMDFFAVADDDERKGRLCKLYRDPARFAEVLLGMIVLFASFVASSEFQIAGIDLSGIRPQ
jgi:hypothetical protein